MSLVLKIKNSKKWSKKLTEKEKEIFTPQCLQILLLLQKPERSKLGIYRESIFDTCD